MEGCLFCKSVNKEIPATFVYENGLVVAFLDINPVNPGHVLVLPKKHSENMLDTDDQILSEIAVTIKKISKAMMEAVGASAFNVEVNNGKVAGQVIFHSHWHIIPRFETDGLKHWPGQKYQDGEMESVAEKIRSNIK